MANVQTILISLRRSTSIKTFLEALRSRNISPLLIARPVEWMILPQLADHLLIHDWDLLLICEAAFHLSDDLETLIDASYTVDVNLPSALPADFREKNDKLLKAEAPPLLSLPKKPLRSLSSQRLELTPSLLAFANSDLCPKGPVSMLNFVSYQPWPEAAENYKKYVDANKAGPMKRIGASVKFIGAVNESSATGE